jgi:hypothetical protein
MQDRAGFIAAARLGRIRRPIGEVRNASGPPTCGRIVVNSHCPALKTDYSYVTGENHEKSWRRFRDRSNTLHDSTFVALVAGRCNSFIACV